MPEPPARALPSPSDLTQPFWEAAARRELVRQVCTRCGASVFTPQIACPRCLSERLVWTRSSGRGVVYSYTVCHRPPSPAYEVPYVLAIVDLEEGWSMLSNVVGCDPADARIGLLVRVAWLELGDSLLLPVFEPEGAL